VFYVKRKIPNFNKLGVTLVAGEGFGFAAPALVRFAHRRTCVRLSLVVS